MRIPSQDPLLFLSLGEFILRSPAAWLALSGASAGGFVFPGFHVGFSTLVFSDVPVPPVCLSCFPRGIFHAGVCRFPVVSVDLPGAIQCLWTR